MSDHEPMRQPLMNLYAESLDRSDEGGARFIASLYEDWFGDDDIEGAMETVGWSFHLDCTRHAEFRRSS